MHNLTGKRFGHLKVIQRTKDKSGKSVWECQCDCGNTTYVTTGHLNSGKRKSCGCIRQQNQKDLIGQRFGKLVVLAKTEERKRGSIWWKCQCDCGNECLKPTNELNYGLAVSCGCSWRQSTVKAGERYGCRVF